METFDLVIVSGTVVDGTGAPAFRGTVAITAGRLRVLADPGETAAGTADAAVTIDARGKVVAPGFVDLHSHSGLMLRAEPLHEPKVRQGVTTEVIGVDGNAYAPFERLEDLAAFVELNAGLDGHPDIPLDWDTVESYLGRFDGKVAVNVAFLVGNSALRIGAIGWERREADARSLGRMRSMLREAMEEGAFGISTGLEYPPGSFATTDELVALGAVAGSLGGIYHTHVRYPLGDRFLDPFREAIEIGRRATAPSHLTHFYHRTSMPGSPDEMLALVDDARAEGLDVTFDAYPYEWSSTRLLISVPEWVQEGGALATKERLADPAVRDAIRRDLITRPGAIDALRALRLGYFARPENARFEGRALAEIAADLGTDEVEAMAELLVAEGLRLNQVAPGPHTDAIRQFYRHPAAMVGTDSVFIGDKPSPRTYGSYPRILGQFVRDERVLGLEEAVRKMTSMPADRVGLRDRGRLVDGAVADVVVFDPEVVRSNATYEEPRRFPDGIEHVLVAGIPVVLNGEHTGATPGRALRRGRD